MRRGRCSRRSPDSATARCPASSIRPLSGYALASRLSYFLWSSMPDEELLATRRRATCRSRSAGRAGAADAEGRPRRAGWPLEFAGNWLDFRRFEEHNTVDRERFPSFTNDLREAMFEEPVRFIEDVIRNDRSVLDLLYGNYTFVNPVLAKHYGMPEVAGDPNTWVRVDDARQYGRGGLLPMAVFLTQNAPGLRTSPVKRGYWVVRRVLGEVDSAAAADVPELPNDEAKLGSAAARHAGQASRESELRRVPRALRFVRPGVRRLRTGRRDARPKTWPAGRWIRRRSSPAAVQGDGFEGVQAFIREHRQKDFVDNLSRKLLAYALGRSLQLSDEPDDRADAKRSWRRTAIASRRWWRRSSPARSS